MQLCVVLSIEGQASHKPLDRWTSQLDLANMTKGLETVVSVNNSA